MGNDYEQLGPERFQEFCQALLASSDPSIQCLPVAQPDGGRDAVARRPTRTTVYQVKYVRNPARIADPAAHLQAVIQSELPKIRHLYSQGVRRYVLLTNLKGSAHPKRGAVDRLQSYMNTQVPMEAQCWWRDDLDRRLEGAWDVRWSYPELLSGRDLARVLIESKLGERTAAKNAIRAYLRQLAAEDAEVRFKQVELQNRLFDLFIDVPLASQNETLAESRHIVFGPNRSVGAVETLLEPNWQKKFPRVVIEGAPGQGKSTITQYLCQLYRLRLLGDSEGLRGVAPHHLIGPLRLPFRVDLRDLAMWLNRRDPFGGQGELAQDAPWAPSLEAFIAAQVRHHSGGLSFTADDLVQALADTPVILVLDALDEVPERTDREKVVREVASAVRRLEELAVSMQTIVTSRPSVFSGGVRFDNAAYAYCELAPLNRPDILAYVERWSTARKLKKAESADIKRLIESRLEEEHLRDLARNPMQLAILLSVVYTKGASLPDKRTALYDSYVEIFFDREVEKSELVRTHRQLLLDLHGYLAYQIHAASETGTIVGSVSETRVQELVSTYLAEEELDSSLVAQLFTGLQRVVFLVSRVEGTYEFEVQPVREYFAGRYLYETAPHSPPGGERPGTKPDRFDALSRNLYWLNAARFFAGCFSKGELASLADRLEELGANPRMARSGHVRQLSIMLLTDWVFAQDRRSAKRVVSLALEGFGQRHALGALNPYEAVSIPPPGSGREEVVEAAWHLAASATSEVRALASGVLRQALTSAALADGWLCGDSKSADWWRVGVWTGALAECSESDALKKLSEASAEPSVRPIAIDAIIGAGHGGGLLLADRDAAVAHLMDGNATSMNWTLDTPYQVPTLVAHGLLFHMPLGYQSPNNSLADDLSHFGVRLTLDMANDDSMAAKFTRDVAPIFELESSIWFGSMEPWVQLWEALEGYWPDAWSSTMVSALGASICAGEVRTQLDFSDAGAPLPLRFAEARARGTDIAWWRRAVDAADSEPHRARLVLAALLSANDSVLTNLEEILVAHVEGFSVSAFEKLARGLRQTQGVGRVKVHRNRLSVTMRGARAGLTPKWAALLTYRMQGKPSRSVREVIFSYDGDSPGVFEAALLAASLDDVRGSKALPWDRWLDLVSNAYQVGCVAPMERHVLGKRSSQMPLSAAESVLQTPERFPIGIVRAAEAACRESVFSERPALASVAKEDRWFDR